MNIAAQFVTSAADASMLPHGDVPEVALVGRSNVGKSSLINALVRQRVARTSAAPGKTRLANLYSVVRGTARVSLVDLPGYGYARGGAAAAREFEVLAGGYFLGQAGLAGQARQRPPTIAALLVVDARHPGLERDRAAWQWLQQAVPDRAIVATKIDKLARGERIRALREFESVLEDSVLPVSAVTGEGLKELWKLIDRLANRRQPPPSSSRPKAARPPRRPLSA